MANKHYCPGCKKEVALRLMADYSSSGLWCKECGLGFEDDFLIEDIRTMLEAWNYMYLLFDSPYINKFWLDKAFRKFGKLVCKKINEYYECVFPFGDVKDDD